MSNFKYIYTVISREQLLAMLATLDKAGKTQSQNVLIVEGYSRLIDGKRQASFESHRLP